MCVGVALAAACAVHVARIVAFPDEDPRWRHALFAAIDLLAAVGFLKRTRSRAFAFSFGVLTVQQLFSHGGAALRAWQVEGRVDVTSLAVLVVMPLATLLLFVPPDPVR